MSPQKKKAKIEKLKTSGIKREIDDAENSNKKRKSDSAEDDKKSIKRKNFVKACEEVSLKAYLNYTKRFNLLHLPQCSYSTTCVHQDVKSFSKFKQIPARIEESFKIEMKTNTWSEALEICFLCINSTQYLSDTVLKHVVEIILNAHEDISANYTISSLLEQCKQVLSLNFNMHPPCLMKSIRKCYIQFLTSPMDLKDNTFTDRSKFNCDKGIVKYCFNRLEYELSIDSKDDALVDRCENTPEEMKQSVQGLHWQKEKFEIFELLKRTDRIERLMAVLESIIELLQLDLVIWHSRYTKNLGCHMMRSHKPMMAYILWSNNILYTGMVNVNCRQILKLYVYFVHLKYPEHHIKTMSMWVNTIIQTFYICENNCNSDYPNIGKYCMAFAEQFFKIISEVPSSSILRILQNIQPTYMRYVISKKFLDDILQSHKEDIIITLTNFIKNKQWINFVKSEESISPILCKTKHIKTNKLLTFLSKSLKKNKSLMNEKAENFVYPKFHPITQSKMFPDQRYVILLIYITFHAYLDAYSIPEIQKTLDTMNEQLDNGIPVNNLNTKTIEFNSYSVTENFIKNYRSIYQMLKDLLVLLHKIKSEQEFAVILNIFETIPFLGL